MADIATLERLIGASQFEVPTVPWAEIERLIGLRLPGDYKRIFDLYPHLEFDRFLGLFHPGVNAEMFVKGSQCALDSIRELTYEQGEIRFINSSGRVEVVSPFPLFPDAGGLFHWGGTQNGDQCLWVTSGPDPDKWPVVVTDHVDYWQYSGGVADFLVGVMQQTIRCPIFPAAFPSGVRIDQFAVGN